MRRLSERGGREGGGGLEKEAPRPTRVKRGGGEASSKKAGRRVIIYLHFLQLDDTASSLYMVRAW